MTWVGGSSRLAAVRLSVPRRSPRSGAVCLAVAAMLATVGCLTLPTVASAANTQINASTSPVSVPADCNSTHDGCYADLASSSALVANNDTYDYYFDVSVCGSPVFVATDISGSPAAGDLTSVKVVPFVDPSSGSGQAGFLTNQHGSGLALTAQTTQAATHGSGHTDAYGVYQAAGFPFLDVRVTFGGAITTVATVHVWCQLSVLGQTQAIGGCAGAAGGLTCDSTLADLWSESQVHTTQNDAIRNLLAGQDNSFGDSPATNRLGTALEWVVGLVLFGCCVPILRGLLRV